MIELIRTNDVVALSWAEAVLRAAGIQPVVLDAHASTVEGSISAIPRRLMVEEADETAARAAIEREGGADLLR